MYTAIVDILSHFCILVLRANTFLIVPSCVLLLLAYMYRGDIRAHMNIHNVIYTVCHSPYYMKVVLYTFTHTYMLYSHDEITLFRGVCVCVCIGT